MRTLRDGFALFILLLLAVLTLDSCGHREGKEEKRMRRVVLPAGEVHEGWYFAAGDEVVIQGTVNGDAYVAAGTVEVDGKINGDLLAAGGQVVVTGSVSDDIRAAGGNVRVSGSVGKNASLAGGSVSVGKSADIGGGLLAAGGTIDVGGTVQKDAKFAAGDLGVTGTINGNVDFGGNDLTVYPGATIGGDLHARMREKDRAEIAEGTVRGKSVIETPEVKHEAHILGVHVWRFWFKILWLFSLLVTGLVIALAFPKHLVQAGSEIMRNPGKTLLWGLVAFVVPPVAVLILMVTLIGIPLALFVLTMYLWTMYLSQLSLGIVAGDLIFRQEEKKGSALVGAFLAGILLVQILTFIPYLGALVVLAGILFGFGVVPALVRRPKGESL